MPHVARELSSLYDTYYSDPVSDRKFALHAEMSMAHIRDLIGAQRFEKVVDVGAGGGSLVELMSQAGLAEQIVALEISSSGLLRIARRRLSNVSAVPFDGYNIRSADAYFDLAISTHVLEHVEHERLFLRELARISRLVLIEVPLELTSGVVKQASRMRPYGHINFYNHATFKNLLETSGLRVLKMGIYPFTPSYSLHVAGPFGVIKNAARSMALRMVPSIAKLHLVYMSMALCESTASRDQYRSSLV